MSSTTFSEGLLETPFGKLRVWATSANHLGLATGMGGGDEMVTINRVSYTLRLDVHPRSYFENANKGHQILMEAGGWAITWESLSLRRPGTYADASDAARRKAREVLVPLLAEWAASDEGRALLSEAELNARRAEVKVAEAQVAEARAALTAAEEALRSAEASLSNA